MVTIENGHVYSTDGKYIHRLSTDSYFKRGTVLDGDTADSFEESDAVPACTSAQYAERVNDLIRERYSISQELAILRQRDTKPQEFAEYNAYAEECKRKARLSFNVHIDL